MFNLVENVKKRSVISNTDLEDFIGLVKSPDIIRKSKINKARSIGKGNKEYDEIKESLPCVCLNFTYKDYVNKSNLENGTGFIYIDADDSDYSTDFSNHSYVVASWKSVSNYGIGVLVSVEGLTKDNYEYAYFSIAEELGINADKRAKSLDRLTIISYDDNVYYNNNYSTYKIDNEKVSFSNNNITNIYRLRPNETFLEVTDLLYKGDIRISDLEEYTSKINFNGEPFIDLGANSIQYSEVYVPKSVKEGSRNLIMFNIASQLYGLNPSVNKSFIKSYCYTVNNRNFNPPLENSEVETIINKVLKAEPKLTKNKSRRIVFNPDYNFTSKERRSMSAKTLNKERGNSTYIKLLDIIRKWDYEEEGKITQKKVVGKIDKHLSTIKRHWKDVKNIVKLLNNENKFAENR